MKRVSTMIAVAGVTLAALAFGSPVATPAGATPTPRAVTADCTPAQLRLSVGRANGAAGTIYYPIIFTNRGAACWIWGVPGVQAVVGTTHHPQGPPAKNENIGEMPARHELRHGAAVSAAFGVAESGNFPVATCRPRNASGVRVTLAPFIHPTYLALRISVCTRRTSTYTQLLVAGRTGA